MASNVNIWRSGDELSFAFIKYSDPYQRQKFHSAPDVGSIEAYKSLMYAELFERLAVGELEAWGFQLKPTPAGVPESLPVHCFDTRPVVSDCDADTIEVSGFLYERIRIVKVDRLSSSERTPSNQTSVSRSFGRPSTYKAAREVLAELHKRSPSVIRKPAARLLDDFNKLFPNEAEAHGLQKTKLSERALRNHLKRFRQELAETGSNDYSN